jgi:hypothetical protein
MKSLVMGIISFYFGVGPIFGLLALASYVWAAFASASCSQGLISHLVFYILTIAYGFFGLVVRTFLWLPSLIHWYIYGPKSFFFG